MRAISCFSTSLVWLAMALSSVLIAADPVDPDLAQGYFLESQRHDPAAAAKYFERAVRNPSATAEDRKTAQRHLERCLEAVKVVDLARLMPADSLLYVEVSQPGDHLLQLARTLGISGSEMDATGSSDIQRIEIDGDLGLPIDFKISPALFDELANINGIAAAVTGFDRDGPQGVVIIDAGNSKLIRGLFETGVQVLKPVDTIDGFRTYQIENEVWVTATRRLIVASRSKDAIVAVLHQMNDSSATGLMGHDAFQQARSESDNPLVFAFIAGQTLRDVLRKQVDPKEAMIANAMLDLDHLSYVSASVNTAHEKITIDARAELAEGHRNLAYGLIRTAPISGEIDRRLPAEAAAYVIVGLNETSLVPISGQAQDMLSALDIGRELFANMQELCVFILPTNAGNARQPLPNVGFIITASDAQRSENLWNQLLSLPSQLGIPKTLQPEEMTIAGHTATLFRLPEGPPIALCRVSDRRLIAGTRDAIQAAVEEKVGDAQHTVSPGERTTANKLIEVDVDRLMQFIALIEPGDSREINQIRELVQDLAISISTHEQDDSLQIHGEIRGLPQLRQVLEKVGSANDDASGLVHANDNNTNLSPSDLP